MSFSCRSCIGSSLIFGLATTALAAGDNDFGASNDPLLKDLGELQSHEHVYREKQEKEEKKKRVEKNDNILNEVQIFPAMLKENSRLIDVDNPKKQVITSRKIYVKIRKERSNNEYYFVLDKEGKVRYQTSIPNVVPIDEVASFDPTPTKSVSYPPPREYDGGDTTFSITPYFNLHFESLTLDDRKASASRAELKGFHKWKLPLEFGLSLSTESGKSSSSDTESQSYTWRSYYLGPIMRYTPWKKEELSVALETSVQKSGNFQRETGSYTDSFAVDVFELGSEARYTTVVGEFTLGLHWRLMRMALDSSNDPSRYPESDKKNNTAWTFSLGYGRRFDF